MSFEFSKLSVLVVEDTKPMRRLICSVLDTLGVGSIYEAKDGEEGFKSFCLTNADILIIDWDMEPIDGLELTRQIRNSPQSPNRLVPIIFLTGYSSVKKVIQARDVGVTEFVVKPFTGADLAKRLAYVINRPRDFIDAESYFGPDRRRKKDGGYTGPKRRLSDEGE